MVGYEMAIGRYEYDDLAKLRDACLRLRPHLFLDVGALYGLYSCVFGLLLESVLAFEPQQRAYAMLRANIERNRLNDRSTLYHAAVGARFGRVRLNDLRARR
jgi:FkbM family methyltransferase